MQRGRGGRDPFFGFGDPFAGFGGPGSLMSSFFGGRDPFDDPFFTRPFESMLGPSMFGPSMFGPGRSFVGESSNAGYLEQAPPPKKSKGPIIKELTSDDEEEKEGENVDGEKKDKPRNQSGRGGEPYVEVPDDETEGKKSKDVQYWNDFNRANPSQPQGRTYSFQSSTVTYGGLNGAYYTSSTTRRTGGNGVTLEESKEANTTTGRATHRVSKGIGDKGHSVTRKLNSDGLVDTVQTLHNLNEDDLGGFEEAWKGNAWQHLPGWNRELGMLDDVNTSGSNSNMRQQQPSRGWALPSAERPQDAGRTRPQPRTDTSKGRRTRRN